MVLLRVEGRCIGDIAGGLIISRIEGGVLELLEELEDEVDVFLGLVLDDIGDIFANGFTI